MFELATQDELDKMGAGATGKSTDNAGFSEEINLEEVKSMSKFDLFHLISVAHLLSF